jgi:hypothetical protein
VGQETYSIGCIDEGIVDRYNFDVVVFKRIAEALNVEKYLLALEKTYDTTDTTEAAGDN